MYGNLILILEPLLHFLFIGDEPIAQSKLPNVRGMVTLISRLLIPIIVSILVLLIRPVETLLRTVIELSALVLSERSFADCDWQTT